MDNTNTREEFSSRFGFIISCVGAALGLGNIWMFSYKLGAYGGAAFLIPYFFFVFVLGSTGLVSEFAFGRRHRAGSLVGIEKTFKSRKLKGGTFVGAIPSIGLMGVLMFYTVVIGWVLKYFALSVTGEMMTMNPTNFFDNFSGTTSSIPWFFLAMFITAAVVCFGVTKGIEKLNKIIMPLILILFVCLTVRSLTLPGSMEGVKYLVTPDFSFLLKAETWVMALGQAFFTLSLNGCGMVVYGSYINDKFNIPSCAITTAIGDTVAALLASFMIIPAVFAFGLDVAAGPSLLFITIPKVFQAMPFGGFLSILFFLSIIFATISSSINMLEGPVEGLMTRFKMGRKKASILITTICFVCALPLATSMERFGAFTDFVTIVISPLCALIVAVVFFYLTDKDQIMNEINKGRVKPIGNWFIPFGKYLFVIVIVLITILGVNYGGIG